MTLRGIDIASHQRGLDIASVDCDFVIVKATQGNSYVNPYCSGWVEGALARGLCVGIYHYISGGGAASEMDYFYNNCRNWHGRVVWCLDWESYQNAEWGDSAYLDACIARLAQLTGAPPVVYASYADFPWGLCRMRNCGTWVAQYANMNPTGYQDNPWNEGAYSCAIRQYTSAGRVNGYSGNLDLNKFYGDRSTWEKYIAGYKGDTDMTDTQAKQLEIVYHMLTRNDDPTGRGMTNDLYTHVKWIAASVSYCSALLQEICAELKIDIDNVGPTEHN